MMYTLIRFKAKRVCLQQLELRKQLKTLDFFFVHGENSIYCCMFIFACAHEGIPKKTFSTLYTKAVTASRILPKMLPLGIFTISHQHRKWNFSHTRRDNPSIIRNTPNDTAISPHTRGVILVSKVLSHLIISFSRTRVNNPSGLSSCGKARRR